jgi:hypothetical protein
MRVRILLAVTIGLMMGTQTTAQVSVAQSPKDVRDLESIEQRVRVLEAEYADSVTTITSVVWSSDTDSVSQVSERHVLRSSSVFREHTLDRLKKSELEPTVLTLRAWDGERMVHVDATKFVTQETGINPVPPPAPPYGPILETLGAGGHGLADLLADDRLAQFRHITVSPTPAAKQSSDGIVIREETSLPGSSLTNVVELYLTPELTPVTGRRLQVNARSGETKPLVTATVISWQSQADGYHAVLDILRTDSDTQTNQSESLEIRTTKCSFPVTENNVTIRQFAGNPVIEHFESGRLISRRNYHPEPEAPRNEQSVLVKWVVINDVLIGLAGIGFGLCAVVRRLRRWSDTAMERQD